MRKVLLLLSLLPLAGCSASMSLSLDGLKPVLQTAASALEPNGVRVTFLEHCVDSVLVISSGETLKNFWIYRNKPVTRLMPAGGTNEYVELTLVSPNGNTSLGTVAEQFWWRNEDRATWNIGNIRSGSKPQHWSVITDRFGRNICTP